MNPLVAEQLKQIRQGVQDLCAILAQADEEVVRQTQARDRLQQLQWSQSKQIAVLKEGQEELPFLRKQNDELTKQCDEIRARLKRILQYTRALGDEYPL